jgi:NTP pyrophosphatase (non-canonical NTP hydrolase)
MVAPEQPQLLGLDVPELSARRRTPSALSVRQLTRWAERQVGAIARITGVGRYSEVFLLSQAVKLGEEVGELHAEILGHLRMQRSDKTRQFDTDTLAGELADVIMSAAVLSQVLGIDLTQAVQTKMATIEHRMTTLSTRSSG